MYTSLDELAEELSQNKTTSVALLQKYIEIVKKSDSAIKAFLKVEEDKIIKLAEDSDARRKAGKPLSKFDGIPIGIKDNILVEGDSCGCASKILEGFVSPYSANVIEKLLGQGFIPFGRLNMDEFAMGSSTENSAYQKTTNPHDTAYAPGGSSGGSAACVSSGQLPITLGSDTGGSIRQPAAFCGVVGLKPTYGSVSRYGLVAFASSLDQIGPLTTNVNDCEVIFNILKGYDKRDSTSVEFKEPELVKNIKDMVIGIPEDMLEGISEEVTASFNKVIDHLKTIVKEVKTVSLPHQKHGIAVYYLTATSEASANLARFDGIRYGNRVQANSLLETYQQTRSKGFGEEVKRRILLGTFALTSGYYDAYYGKSQKVRRLIKNDYINNFKTVDVIMMPTTPTPAFKIGEKTDDPLEMYLADKLTVGASLAGIPAISIPGPSEKLPIGIQLQANYFQETTIFKLAKEVEKEFGIKEPK